MKRRTRIAALVVVLACAVIAVRSTSGKTGEFEEFIGAIERAVVCDWWRSEIGRLRIMSALAQLNARRFLLHALYEQQETCGVDNTAEIEGLRSEVLNSGVDSAGFEPVATQ